MTEIVLQILLFFNVSHVFNVHTYTWFNLLCKSIYNLLSNNPFMTIYHYFYFSNLEFLNIDYFSSILKLHCALLIFLLIKLIYTNLFGFFFYLRFFFYKYFLLFLIHSNLLSIIYFI